MQNCAYWHPMKYPTLQKVSLTTIALVASLALSAQAGNRGKVSSVRQMHHQQQQTQTGHRAPMTARSMWHDKLTSTYQMDDASAEDAVGFGNGSQNFESLWFNQFAVIPGAETISSVEVAWGTPNFPDPFMDGTPVTIAVWSDPNGDGSPTDAALLGSVAGTIQNSGTDTFVTYTLSPAVTLPAGATSFFVGDLTPMNGGPQEFFQGIDQNSTNRQSWIAAMSSGGPVDINNPGNNDFLGVIDDFGLPGIWLIRANSGDASPTPTPTPTATPTPTPPGNALWYNGDFDGVNGLANEQDTSLGAGQFSSIYDDFIVTDPSGWDVTSVFSDNLADTNVTGANWEIRQGISEGNGGTLVASGTTLTPNVTATGRSGFGFTEFMVEVPGLNVHLAAGNYFLNVTPIGDLTGRSFDSTTVGLNAVGTPPGNNQNAFWNSNFFGFNWTLTGNQGFPYDFSMGVNGTVTGQGGLTLVSAASSKKHGNAGVFNIDLPLTGAPGVECRQGALGTATSIVFTFSDSVTSVDSTSTSCGRVISTTASGATVTVLLNNVQSSCDGSDVTVTLTGVNGGSGSLASAAATFGVLAGDVNGDGTVDASDLQQVRGNSGAGLVTSANFRDDVSVDGKVNHADINLTRAARGNSLP
jgi:hypothetical protein